VGANTNTNINASLNNNYLTNGTYKDSPSISNLAKINISLQSNYNANNLNLINKSNIKAEKINNNKDIKSFNENNSRSKSPNLSNNNQTNVNGTNSGNKGNNNSSNRFNNNLNKQQNSKRFMKSDTNSLNLKSNFTEERDYKGAKNANAGVAAEEFLDTSAIINKLFANKRDSIDFSMNSFKIEKDQILGGGGVGCVGGLVGNTSNNLNYVNKPSKNSSGGKLSKTNLTSNKDKDKNANVNANTNANLNLILGKENSKKDNKDKNNSNNIDINNNKTSNNKNSNASAALKKNSSSAIIKKPNKNANAEFNFNNETEKPEKLEKQSEKEDLKSKITPYTSRFNSKLFKSSSNTVNNNFNFNNNAKRSSNNLIKKEKSKNNLNTYSNTTQLKQSGGLVNVAKNENSFSPTYKLRKEYSEINTEKIRKLVSSSQEKNNLGMQASSRTKSNSKEKNGFFDKKVNVNSKNKEKETGGAKNNKYIAAAGSKNNDNNNNNICIKNQGKEFLDLKSDINNNSSSYNNNNQKFSRNDIVNNTERFSSGQTQNSNNPFCLASNYNYNNNAEGKQIDQQQQQPIKKVLGKKTKSKVVMIDLNNGTNPINNNYNKNGKKSTEQKESEIATTETKIFDDNNRKYLCRENNQNRYIASGGNTDKYFNNNNHKISSFNLINKSNTLKEDLFFLKSESENYLNIAANANKEFPKAKSNGFTGTSALGALSAGPGPNKDYNNPNSILQQVNTQDTNTLNMDDYTINPEQNLYKSNKVKRVLKKDQRDQGELLVCASASQKSKTNVDFYKYTDSNNNNKQQQQLLRLKLKQPTNNSDGGNELEEHQIILNRSVSQEKIGNDRYAIVNNISEKIAAGPPNDVNINRNEKENKVIGAGNSLNFKINLQDLKDNKDKINYKKKNSHSNFSMVQHPNYLKIKEYSTKKVNTNLFDEINQDSNPNRFSLRQSSESISNLLQNKNIDYEFNDNNNINNNIKNGNNNGNNEIPNVNNKENKIYIKLGGSNLANNLKNSNSHNNKTYYNNFIQNSNLNSNKNNYNSVTDIISKKNTDNTNNNNTEHKGSLKLSTGRRSNRLTDAREQKFSKRFSTEKNNNTLYNANNNSSTERTSDINKLNQKLNDVCHNLALFKIKSDSLRNSSNMDNNNNNNNNKLGSDLRGGSSDFEFNNCRRNLTNINMDNTVNNENFTAGHKRKEKLNALRSSDPTNYSNNIKLDSKLMKQVILSHR